MRGETPARIRIKGGSKGGYGAGYAPAALIFSAKETAMFTLNAFVLFMAGALTLNIAPGPDMAFVLAQSTARGTHAGLLAALGIGAGCVVHVLLATFGLSAVLAASPLAFDIVRYAGAAYLLWIAIAMVRNPPHLSEATPTVSAIHTFRQGMLTNVTNPKVAIFFIAFLPQFVVPGPTAWAQFLLLGLSFNISGTLVCCLVALGGGALASRLRHHPLMGRIMGWLSACVMLALAMRLVLADRR